MDTKNLESFVMAAELNNFTQAAHRLGYTQSTISFQIRQLEEQLGVPLFERIHHAVTLTNEGRRLLPLAHDMIRMAAEASHIAGSEAAPEGCVRIAIAASLCAWQFGEGFAAFHRSYPGITLSVTATRTAEMFRLLGENQVDLVYTLDRQIFDRNYRVAFEASVPVHFVAAAEHPLARARGISVERVLEQPLLLTERGMSYRALLDEELARRGTATQPLFEVGETHLLCELLRQGAGVSFLPDFVTQADVEAGILARLDVPEIDIRIWRQLLYHRNKWLSPELRCVIEYLRERSGEMPAAR